MTNHAKTAINRPCLGLCLGACLLLSGGVQAQTEAQSPGEDLETRGDKEARQEIETLREQIEALERRLDELEAQSQRRLPDEEHGPLVEEEPTPEPSESMAERMSDAVPGTERSSEEPPQSEAAPEPAVQIGGALRFNIIHRDFVDASQSKYGESGLDVFRLNVDGQVDNILISAEYRYYSYMQTIHHGWLGYEFDDESQLQFGIHQVPFGLLPYAAHNAWFGVPYYLGLADDYDMGVKYERTDGPWNAHLAFYKNEELNDPTDPNRYSFDLVRAAEHENEEVNQFNARLAYSFGLGGNCETELGGSAQAAEIYNAQVDKSGDHWAGAVHLDSRCGRWNLQLQALRYEYDPVGSLRDSVRVGAFGASYDIDREADVVVANLAYNFDSPWAHIEQIVCYNDYSQMLKSGNGLDSRINTTGCAVGSGALFTYVDYILANNMAFFGSGSMAAGGEDEWHGRFNVNIGFYW